jgi:transposase
MARAPRQDPKSQALARDGALNPEAVRDALFADNPFFDPKDLVQVRYEMVRHHKADGIPISDVAATFGVSRPTFYKAQDTLAAAGFAGLLPQPRGPRGGHKISAEVVAFVVDLKAATPELTTPHGLAAVDARFGMKVHRRSLERALARKKTPRPAVTAASVDAVDTYELLRAAVLVATRMPVPISASCAAKG